MAITNKTALAMLAAAVFATTAARASVLDDAVFKLDLRGGASTYTKPGDLGNAYDFSSAAETKAIGFMGDQRGAQTYSEDYGRLPAQETVEVTNPWYPMTTNTTTCLHFYQDEKEDAKKGPYSVRSSVVISNAATHATTQTFYLRFRWDGVAPVNASDSGSSSDPAYLVQSGNATNGHQANGLAVGIWKTSKGKYYLGSRTGSQTGGFSTFEIETNKWHDAFVTFAPPSDGEATYTVTISICATPKAVSGGFDRAELMTSSVKPSTAALSFDSYNLTLGGFYDSGSGYYKLSRSFRGLIADLMIWERALTDDEKIEVMAGRHGTKWTVGAPNGSSDEFNDGTDANVPVADVFEPETMPWRRMRKTLDAAHPSLSIKSPLATGETNMPMIVTVTPVLSGVASEPVTVSVNGTPAAAETLVSGRTQNIVIPAKRWQRDANGNVTVTITRTTTAGTLSIDAISLSGSWNAGGRNTDMSDSNKIVQYAFAGDPVSKHFTRHVQYAYNATNLTFALWLPPGIGSRCGYKFSTTINQDSGVSDPLTESHAILVNGAVVATHEGKFENSELFEADIPAGAFRDGMNLVEFQQTSPTKAEATGVSVYNTYHYYRMTLVPPPVGMVVVFR